MYDPNNGTIYMGLDDAGRRVTMQLSQANRHGLIAGASGTGKTVTMKVMAESFSAAGVPVFMCDVKGDVSGICMPGTDSAGMQKRIDKFGIRDSFVFRDYPTVFYDIYGRGGHPVRTTVSDVGATLLSRMLGLTDIQEGVLNTIFRIADDRDLAILDMKDLRAVINYVNDHRSEYTVSYGNMAPQSIGAITRALIPLEEQGGSTFFGEPALDINDWIRRAPDGRGYINVLHCTEVIKYPKLYAMFLLWMMAELFEVLPEVGDGEKPKLVFFFDEAHVLFKDTPKPLIEKIEQTVKLIRSKGVGIYFVTQSPSDIPDTVLAQLSNRVQHALRAYTPAEQKAVRTAAQTFRANPAFRTEDVIMTLGTGEALVSFLDEYGIPSVVQKTSIICPESLMAPCTAERKQEVMSYSPVYGKYDMAVDNESAYEVLEREDALAAERAELERQRAELEAEKARLIAEREKAEQEAEKARQKAEADAEKARQKAEADAEKARIRAEEQAEREALRAAEKAEKEAAAAAARAEKEAAAAAAKAEKAAEKEAAAKAKKKDRLMSKIETQVISTGGTLLKRGLLGILKW